MLFEADLACLDGPPVPGGEAGIPLHRHDAGAGASEGTRAAQKVDVVAGRLFDELEVLPALTDQFANEGEGPSMQ